MFKRVLRRYAVAACTAGALVILSSPGSQAKPSDDSVLAQAKTAFAHSSAGYLTDEDRAFLDAHPEIAAAIPDPSLTEWGTEEEVIPSNSVDSKAFAAPKNTCKATNRYQVAKSVTKVKLYEYHTRVSWCTKPKAPNNIVTWDQYAYFEDVNGAYMQVKNEDSLAKTDTLAPNKRRTRNKGVIENCILKVGCIGTKYPQNQVLIHGLANHFSYNQDNNKGWIKVD